MGDTGIVPFLNEHRTNGRLYIRGREDKEIRIPMSARLSS